AMADQNLFSIFTLPMLEGDAKTALTEPNAVVITQQTAKKYFGNADAIGKTISVSLDSNRLYRVTGIIKNIPSNSHFHFDLFASMNGWADAKSATWLSGGYHTYILLRPGTDLKKMEARFPAMVEKYMGPQVQQQMGL